jgi:hypothetical protein
MSDLAVYDICHACEKPITYSVSELEEYVGEEHKKKWQKRKKSYIKYKTKCGKKASKSKLRKLKQEFISTYVEILLCHKDTTDGCLSGGEVHYHCTGPSGNRNTCGERICMFCLYNAAEDSEDLVKYYHGEVSPNDIINMVNEWREEHRPQLPELDNTPICSFCAGRIGSNSISCTKCNFGVYHEVCATRKKLCYSCIERDYSSAYIENNSDAKELKKAIGRKEYKRYIRRIEDIKY